MILDKRICILFLKSTQICSKCNTIAEKAKNILKPVLYVE